MRTPTILDLAPGVQYAQQVAHCCRNGVISAFAQDSVNSVSSFSITVGRSGTPNVIVRIPEKLTLKSAGPEYTCSDLEKVAPTRFPKNNVTSQYFGAECSNLLFIAFGLLHSDIVKCPDCACSCRPNVTRPGINALPGTEQTCISTNDMCPVKIHWHIKESYVKFWRAKATITNRSFKMNYNDWNIVVHDENFDNLTEASSFTINPLSITYGDVGNDTAMFWGVQYYSEMLLEAGPMGNVQSELLFAKDSCFTTNGWRFPTLIYFNGDECILPDPQDYPKLPDSAHKVRIGLSSALSLLLVIVLSTECLSL